MRWLGLALLLAACSHESEPPAARSDRLVVLLDEVPKDLDPRFATEAVTMRVSRLVFSSLVTLDNPSVTPEGELAERWETDPADPAIVTVVLKPKRHWHDGRPVTADDVVYTFQSVMDPTLGSPFREPYAAHLRAVEAVDARTIRFRLVEPYATFLTDLVLGIVPKHVLEPNGGRFPAPDGYVGSGPFRFVGRDGERRIDLEAARTVPKRERPKVRHVELRTLRDEGTRLLTLLGGGADLMVNGASPVLSSVIEAQPGLKLETAPSIAFTYLALNLRNPALAERRVRQALAYALPREQLIGALFGGKARLATGMLSPLHWAHAPEVATYPHDPDRARALLAEAGYGPTRPLQLTIKISTNRFRRTVARAIATAWKAVGVDARVRTFEFSTFFADVKAGRFDAFVLDLPEPMEPDMLRWMFHGLATPTKTPAASGSAYATADRRYLTPGALDDFVAQDPLCRGYAGHALAQGTRIAVQRAFGVEPALGSANRTSYANPLVDCRLELGQLLMTPEQRAPLYRDAQRLLADDLPVIPLWHEDVRVVTSTRVEGFLPLPNGRLGGLVHARLAK